MQNQFAPPIPVSAYPEFPDYEQAIARMTISPIIANEFDTSIKEQEDRLKALIYTKYQGDTISPIPTCSCGKLSGGANEGLVCGDCGTECINTLERPIETRLWVQSVKEIEKFIGPGFWLVMSSYFTASKWCLMDYLVLPDYPDPPEKSPFIPIVETLTLEKSQRNLNFFYHNFEHILYRIVKALLLKKKPRDVEDLTPEEVNTLLLNVRDDQTSPYEVLLETPIGDKLSKEKDFAKFAMKYTKEKSRVFTKFLAMPSSAGMVLETNSSGTWYDDVMLVAVDAMYTITQLERSQQPKTFRVLNAKTVEAIKTMARFSELQIRERWMKKKGMVRSHYVGGRQPFTMRCVIVPITQVHRHNELHIPWSAAVEFFRLDITNKLRRRKYSPEFGRWHPNAISRFLTTYMNQYHPLMDELFQEIIREAKGVKVLFNRPPSLKRGSIQLMEVTRVKTDPRVKSVSMSIGATNSPNADAHLSQR